MICPQCKDTTLSMTERQGVEIDYCGKCRGIWLDRGELDKIIEKSQGVSSSESPEWSNPSQGKPDRSYGHYKHKRKKSFLEELFD
ncbi:MAG: zf-TFIIB domain-containing protein [Bdellovibrionales bacterium]